MENLEAKLLAIRNESAAKIRETVKKTDALAIYFVDLDSSPMVTPTQSLDSVEMIKDSDQLFFTASGENDNGTYVLDDVSTDLLVEVVELIEEKGDILFGGDE